MFKRILEQADRVFAGDLRVFGAAPMDDMVACGAVLAPTIRSRKACRPASFVERPATPS